MVVVFTISLQSCVVSAMLSSLHSLEHAAHLVDATHQYGHRHFDELHHGHDLATHSVQHAEPMAHTHVSTESSHGSGGHGFFHSPAGPALSDLSGSPLSILSLHLSERPALECEAGHAQTQCGVPHRPPIA